MILPLVTPLPFCYQFHWITKPISQGSRQVAVEEHSHSPLRRDALMTVGLLARRRGNTAGNDRCKRFTDAKKPL